MRNHAGLLTIAILLSVSRIPAAEMKIEKSGTGTVDASEGKPTPGGDAEKGKPSSSLSTNIIDEVARQIYLEVGQTKLVHISEKVIRVSVAEPDVSDVQVVTPKQVLITAKSVGYTHLILWNASDEPLVIAVSVTKNLDQLRSQFKELFPNEKISVSSVGDLVVLSGTVSDLRIPARAAEVAALHSERLANLIQVSGDQQVQLDVRFAEVSRSGLKKVGMNFLWRDTQRGYVAGQSGPTTTNGEYTAIPGTGVESGPPVVPAAAFGDTFNVFFSTGLSQFPFSAILSILAQEGLAKMLAEPSLVAQSGQDAEFHAGGEVPILTSQGLGTVQVNYKKFGVQLKFTPTVLGEKSMSLKLGIEVSEPDPNVSVAVAGYQIPGFKSRSSETTIRLKDGQSFAIAGLLSDAVRSTVRKVPLLGDIPILGILFRSSAYQREETELLMVVTAHLVRPLTPDELPSLPGEDYYNDPRDIEFFLMGTTRPKKTEDAKQKEMKENQKRQQKEEGSPTRVSQKSAELDENDTTEIPVSPKGETLLSGPTGPVGFMRE